MKFIVTYECKSNEIFQGKFLINLDHEPKESDPEIIKIALKDSTKFNINKLIAIRITSITATK